MRFARFCLRLFSGLLWVRVYVMCSLVLGLEVMILLLEAASPLQANSAKQTHKLNYVCIRLTRSPLEIPRGNFSVVIVEEVKVDAEPCIVFECDFILAQVLVRNLYHWQSDGGYFSRPFSPLRSVVRCEPRHQSWIINGVMESISEPSFYCGAQNPRRRRRLRPRTQIDA